MGADVADAGVRDSGSMVRKLTPQEAMVAMQPKSQIPSATSFQEVLANESTENYRTTQTRGTGHPNRDRYAGSVFGSLNAIKLGGDIYDNIDKEIGTIEDSTDPQNTVAARIAETSDEQVRLALDVVSASTDDTDTLMAAYQQLKQWRLDMGDSPGFEAFTETQLSGLAALQSQKGKQVLQENIFRNYGDALVAKEYDQHGVPDKVWDFIKLNVGISGTVAMADFTAKFEPGWYGSIINTLGETVGRVTDFKTTGRGYNAYKQVYADFWQQPVEKRLMLLDQLEAHIRDIAADNTFVYMSMMMPFIDKSTVDDIGLDYLVDTVTLGSLIPAKTTWKVFNFMRQAANARKPIQMLKRTGNIDKAGEIINRALGDSAARAKRITGQTQDEIAASAHPLDMSQIMPEQISGAAGEAAKQLEKEIYERVGVVDQAYINTTDPSETPVRYYFDESAKRQKQRETVGDLNDYPNFARVTEQADDGFTVEVERGSKYEGSYDPESLEAANDVLAQHVQDTSDSLEALRKDLIKAQGIKTRQLKKQADLEGLGVARRPKGEAAREADEAFATDSDAERLRQQLTQWKEQIKRNEKIIKDLRKPPKTDKVPVKYTFKESGTYAAEEGPGYFASRIFSPSQTVEQIAPGTVDSATLAEFTETQILGNINHATREARRGLTGKQMKDVDQLLMHGDEMGREFSIAELVDGVDTKWGRVQLDSTNSIGAYYAMRRNLDNMHRVKNYIFRRELEVGDFREVNLKLKNDNGDPIKVFAKPSSERKTIPEDVKRIYDHKTGTVVDVDMIPELGTRMDKDWIVTRFRHGYRFGDEIINYGLVQAEKDLKPIKGQVLNYRPGYVPRQRPLVFYVAQRRVPRLVDGVKKDSYETARFFSTEAEAYEWKASQPDFENLYVLPDKRYKSSAFQTFDEEFDTLNFGGLYTGERTDRTILMGLDGKQAQRMSAYKSMQLYTNHIANRYSTNELKMNLIGRFQNTYGKYLANRTDWRAPLLPEAHNDLSLRNAIENQRHYIENILRLPDDFQNWWSSRMRSLAESMEGKPLVAGKIRDWTMSFGARDPVAFLRAATFHQYLGVFNPSQILVQGLGMATAAAAYPGHALKLFPKNMALRAAWLGRKNPEAIRMIADAIGMNGDELVDVVNEIHRVGLFDSLKTSADYNAATTGISLSADALRGVMDSGLIFMREGEQFARGYGYLLARELFLKNKKKNYVLTEKDIDQVAKDSTKFTLNLNRANRAWWQKGALSIPTQFWQVTVKFMENMVAGAFDETSLTSKVGTKFGRAPMKGIGVRKWTQGEKAKIMFGYLGMFGMAGIPFTDSIVSSAVNAYKESTDDPKAMTAERLNPFNNLPPELRVSDQEFARFIRGGLLQVMAHWITGADPEIVSRVSIPAGIEDTIDLYKSGDKDTVTALGGAALPGQARWLDAAMGLYDILAPGKNVDLTDEEMKQAINEVAKIMSSTRNAEKAAWWYEVGRSVTNKKGQRLFPDMETDEWNSTLLWQSLGFSPAKVGWMYDLQESTTELKARVSGKVDEAWTIMQRYSPDKDAVDSIHKRDAINFRINLLLKDLSPAEQVKFYEQLKKKITDDGAKAVKIIADAVKAEAVAEGIATPGSTANPLLVPEEGSQ